MSETLNNPLTLTAAGSAAVLVLALWSFGVLLWDHRSKRAQARIHERLDLRPAGVRSRTLRLWHDGRQTTTHVEADPEPPKLSERLEQLRLDAGWKASIQSILLALGLALLGVAIGLLVVTGRLLPPLLGVFVCLVACWWHAHQRVARRRVLFQQQLIDGLELSARALRAGHPLLGSFQLISEEVPDPVGSLFTEICQSQAMGVGLDEALRRVAVLSRSDDMRLFSATIAINLKTGGNLANVMEGLAGVLRERMRLGRRFRVLIAQTQISKRILIALPFVLFGVLNVISPEYMAVLYATSTGNALLLAAAASLLFGWLVMNRMADLKA